MARKNYDDFDEADQDGIFDQIFGIISRKRKAFAIVSVLAAVLVLGLIVWDSYPKDAEEAVAESVPIVRADAGDYKTAPDNPGGMEVPYRDSTVFSSNAEGGTENILAEDQTEKPVSRDEAFAGLNTEQQAAPGITATEEPTGGEVEDTQAALEKVEPVQPSNDTLVSEAIGVPPQPEAKAAEEKPAPVEEAKVEEIAPTETEEARTAEIAPAIKEEKTVKAEAKKAAKTEPAAGSTAAKASGKTGGSYVQLAAIREKSAAAAEWKKLSAKYPFLGKLQYRTQEANLGDKGVFHRIQAGPMAKDTANVICKQIKQRGGTCMVVGK
jgi:outer membrane biosynthesis protein TonB